MRVRVSVRERIYVRLPRGADRLYEDLAGAFEHFNPARVMKEKIGVFAKDEPHIIKTWRREGSDADTETISFPRGGMARVRQMLDKHGAALDGGDVWDEREYGQKVPVGKFQLSLYPHQENALAAIAERENCILRAPTGSGKTTIILAAAARFQVPVLIVVPNRALFDQWVARITRELGIPKNKIGMVGAGKHRLAPITVGIQKSVALRSHDKGFTDFFGMVVGDEVDLFAAKTFFASIDPFPARYRFGISADHRRKDRKEFLIHDLFGEVVMHIKHEDLVASGHVLDVKVVVIPTEFRADWYGAAQSSEDKPDYDMTKLVTEMMHDADRNRLIMREIRKRTAQGDQAIVMAHLREHCMMIDQALSGMGTRSGLLLGGDEGSSEFANTVKALSSGKLTAGVGTYKAIARGLDIPRLHTAVCATPCAANEQVFKQVRGRVCRTSTGKSGAELIYFWDRFVFPEHLANLKRWNANTVVQLEDGTTISAKDYLKRAA